LREGLCKKRRPRPGDGSNNAGGFFLTAATDSALTNINAMSRIFAMRTFNFGKIA